MANTIKVSFWLHRSKENKDGLVPLMIRLTYQKQKADKATGYYINSSHWDGARQKLKGSRGGKINEWINLIKVKVMEFMQPQCTTPVHLPSLMQTLFASVEEAPSLLRTIEVFNEELRQRVNRDYSASTYEKYVFTYDKIKAFIRNHLKKKDVMLKDLTTTFIMDFDQYMRVHDNNKHNTAVKYCLNLKRILNVAVLKGLLPSNPFNKFKTTYKDTPQVYLSIQEVELIEKARLIDTKHIRCRDIFLFQCYTGLAFTDLANLTKADISTEVTGEQWIIKARQKTEIIATIPLLPAARVIIAKYNSAKMEGMFPTYSIQKYNKYLGEIGDMLGITKKISSHVGRRTFGNVALSKGISINVISKILGHSNTIITQRIYAITTQNIIRGEMGKW